MHARAKLLKGYVLIIADGRRTASFFKEGRGFEPCPFKIAKALVEMGLVEEAGTHFLGTRFVLSSAAPVPPPVVEPDEEDETDDAAPREQAAPGMEGLLDDLEAEQTDEDEEEGEAATDDESDAVDAEDEDEEEEAEEEKEEDY
jgi:hypothetical protein